MKILKTIRTLPKLIAAFTLAILALFDVPAANALTTLQECQENAKKLICIAATEGFTQDCVNPDLSNVIITRSSVPGGSFFIDVRSGTTFAGGQIHAISGSGADSSSCQIRGDHFTPLDGVFVNDAEYRNWKSDVRLLSRDPSVAFQCDWGTNPPC
jgi:hypothetical protein